VRASLPILRWLYLVNVIDTAAEPTEAPNAAIAFSLHAGAKRRGVGDPDRSTKETGTKLHHDAPTRFEVLPPDSILLSGSNAQEILAAYNKAIGELAPDVREQFAAVMKKHLGDFGLDGVAERLNGRTVAQIIAEIPPDELQSLVRRRFIWQEVRSTALTGTAAAVRSLSCPKCGGALSVRFDPSSPQPDSTTAGFLIVRCLECSSGCAADRLQETPPWVESLGLSAQTQARIE
jgi:hypothetical protein